MGAMAVVGAMDDMAVMGAMVAAAMLRAACCTMLAPF